ncbi:hypothetical protein Ltuc_1698 [Legionella tucsonensis]|uniref:Uncharacterized protein n=1 Tax=Legionella tucsonensis TaxID=40335 RepID=A0A0W0ZXJ0_9GAMM|nr:hypothetical protein Ltuc_1698 [Legionella tucsonensis]
MYLELSNEFSARNITYTSPRKVNFVILIPHTDVVTLYNFIIREEDPTIFSIACEEVRPGA